EIDVEHRTLCALVKNTPAVGVETPQDLGDIGNERPELLRVGEQHVELTLRIDRLGTEMPRQHEVVEVEQTFKLALEYGRQEEIGDSERPPRDLVFVSRPDSAPRRTDRIHTASGFSSPIERDVRRQDQWARR